MYKLEITNHERTELVFLHKAADAADVFYELDNHITDPKVDMAFKKGEAIQVMADLMVQRFGFAEIMIHDNHSDGLECDGEEETKRIFTEYAQACVTNHVMIGMLNHNTSMLTRMRKAFPDEYNIVYSIYRDVFSEIYDKDSPYMDPEFFEYKIELD